MPSGWSLSPLQVVEGTLENQRLMSEILFDCCIDSAFSNSKFLPQSLVQICIDLFGARYAICLTNPRIQNPSLIILFFLRSNLQSLTYFQIGFNSSQLVLVFSKHSFSRNLLAFKIFLVTPFVNEQQYIYFLLAVNVFCNCKKNTEFVLLTPSIILNINTKC